MPTVVPAGVVTVTVAPGSAVPTTAPPPGATVAVGAAGAVVSGAVTESGGEALPAASVWTTVRGWPFACAAVRGTWKLPLAATVVVPSTVPPAPVTVTRAPGSPVPVTTVPTPSIVAAGAAGAVVSGAVTESGGEALPAASVWTIVRGWPFACAAVRGTWKLPLAATVAVPSTTPPAPVTVTRAPGSPVPVTVAPAASIVAVGAAGAVRSGVWTWVAGETLPAASVWVTASGWPSARGVASGAVKAPSAPTVAVATTAPEASRTWTVAPASPRPLTWRPSPLTVAVGAAGGSRSGAWPTGSGSEMAPPPDERASPPPPPSANAVAAPAAPMPPRIAGMVSPEPPPAAAVPVRSSRSARIEKRGLPPPTRASHWVPSVSRRTRSLGIVAPSM